MHPALDCLSLHNPATSRHLYSTEASEVHRTRGNNLPSRSVQVVNVSGRSVVGVFAFLLQGPPRIKLSSTVQVVRKTLSLLHLNAAIVYCNMSASSDYRQDEVVGIYKKEL